MHWLKTIGGAAGICGHHAFDNECGHISANDLIQMRDVEY